MKATVLNVLSWIALAVVVFGVMAVLFAGQQAYDAECREAGGVPSHGFLSDRCDR